MKSITKNRHPLETLQAMIERAYESTQVPGGDDFGRAQLDLLMARFGRTR
ncbi:hypothetical protein AB0K18_30270 [Nonomuraea sp. NPDC049421]